MSAPIVNPSIARPERELALHQHGKSRVRVARTWREGSTHHFVEWTVSVWVQVCASIALSLSHPPLSLPATLTGAHHAGVSDGALLLHGGCVLLL